MDLSISERLDIGRYINLIRCTIPIRLSIDEFYDKFIPSADELRRAGAVIESGRLAEIKDNFVKSYNRDDVPACIRDGISEFVNGLEANKNADSEYVNRITSSLKKLL